MEKLSPNRAQIFLCNKYTVFTMDGSVALRSVNKHFSGELQFCSQLFIKYNLPTNWLVLLSLKMQWKYICYNSLKCLWAPRSCQLFSQFARGSCLLYQLFARRSCLLFAIRTTVDRAMPGRGENSNWYLQSICYARL